MASFVDKMEEAAGITPSEPKMPYQGKERVQQGGTARPWTGLKPWSGEKGRSRTYKGNDGEDVAVNK